MPKFEINEIAIGQYFINVPSRNGMECEIIKPLQVVTGTCITTGKITTSLRYKVRWEDGMEIWVKPFKLRKKKPPQEYITWEQFKEKLNSMTIEDSVNA